MTEHNTHKFFVKASEKLHEVITTHPKEHVAQKPKTSVRSKEKPKIDLSKGIYLESELKDGQAAYLLANGYVMHRDRLSQRGGSHFYLVKKRHNEGEAHAFLCWITCDLLRKHFKNVQLFTNKPGDVVVTANGKSIAFEIETGNNFRTYEDEEHIRKFEAVRKSYDDFYIIISDWSLRKRYKRFGKVVTRNEVESLIAKIAQHNIGNRYPSKNKRIKA